ncbi:hypothetical protein T4E_4748 [Trichinella pseudospiralis]|uniref:Uncharacterized protein n=1 Tax=Trichinella pseudospiralis TaxID=6337 RepID=A0A0V0XY00_TRIPS|nr:hypothetical protein T4E_4748 [Trichinella pseudospiralis]
MRQTTSVGWKIFTTPRLLPINVHPVRSLGWGFSAVVLPIRTNCRCDSPLSILTSEIAAEAARQSQKESFRLRDVHESMQIPRATYCFEKNRLNSDLENIMHRLDCRRNCALLRFDFSWFWAIHRGDPDES